MKDNNNGALFNFDITLFCFSELSAATATYAEGVPDETQRDEIFSCFVKALEEDPVQTRADANELAEFASSAGSVDALVADPMFADIKVKGQCKLVTLA